MFSKNTNSEIKRIAILRFGAIGDVVHTLGLVRAIKQAYPDILIDYLTFKSTAELLAGDPDINRIITVEDKSYKYLSNLANKLQTEQYDLFINLQPALRTFFFAHSLGAKKQITFKKHPKKHAVEDFWNTGKRIFDEIKLPENLKLYSFEQIPAKLQDCSKPIVTLNPGASLKRQGRIWPIERWIRLAEELLNNYECNVVITGAPSEREMADKICASVPEAISVCGELSLRENVKALEISQLVISGDTGPLHMATATGSTTIGIFGAPPIYRTGPYGKGHFTVTAGMNCIPCCKKKCKYGQPEPCMANLHPEAILKVIESNSLLVRKSQSNI